MISLVMGLGLLMTQGVSRALSAGIRRLGGELEKDLRTGRAPLVIWKLGDT
jgi:hypothetical protein